MINRLQIASLLIIAMVLSTCSTKIYLCVTLTYLSFSFFELYSLKKEKDISKGWIVYFSFLILSIPFYFKFDLAKFSFVLMCCILCDSSGYIFGKMLGGKKPFPKISPNKTIYGYVASYIITTIIALATYKLFGIESHLIFSKILLIITVAIFGDLFESKFKRYYGLKDTSKFLGEHGGILDRIDGYLCLSLILIL